MPNIGTALKAEIVRLARREIRSQIDAPKKTAAQHRKQIVELKHRVAQLERQVNRVTRNGQPPAAASVSTAGRPRFAAKGLRAQRKRLGLSAMDYGKLIGVSAQSIYNWERELASPRAEQVSRLAALRGIGKREAGKRLSTLGSDKGTAPRNA